MQHGLRVHLNPSGGNQLNIREALRVLNPPLSPTPVSDGGDSDSSDVGETDAREPRRTALDDYDYDDDFIDDGELVEDDEVPPTPPSEDSGENQSDTENPAVPRRPTVSHGFTSFYASRGELPPRPTVDAAALGLKPASKLGNVAIDFPAAARRRLQEQLSQANATSSSDANPNPSSSTDKAIESAPVPDTSESPVAKASSSHTPTANDNNVVPSAPSPPPPPSPPTPPPPPPSLPKPSTTADTVAPGVTSHADHASTTKNLSTAAPTAATGGSQTASARSKDQSRPAPTSSAPSKNHSSSASTGAVPGNTGIKSTRPLPPVVKAEIDKLSELCAAKFGDKKPKLDDPRVQEQLDRMFRVAIDAGVARLYSDIQKDKRVVTLNDEVWKPVAQFLRAKRLNLEMLGHALWWSAKEKDAKAAVDAAEARLSTSLVEKRPKDTPADAIIALEWSDALDQIVHDWYKAKTGYLEAKNQLASRFKSVKKSIDGWVTSLNKQVFTGWKVAETDISSAIRRIDEKIAAERKQRNDRKRKREEPGVGVEETGSTGGNENGPERIETTVETITQYKKHTVDNTAPKSETKKMVIIEDTSSSKPTTKKTSAVTDTGASKLPAQKNVIQTEASGSVTKTIKKSGSLETVVVRPAQKKAPGNAQGSTAKTVIKRSVSTIETSSNKGQLQKTTGAMDGSVSKTPVKKASTTTTKITPKSNSKHSSGSMSTTMVPSKKVSSGQSRTPANNTSKAVTSGPTSAKKPGTNPSPPGPAPRKDACSSSVELNNGNNGKVNTEIKGGVGSVAANDSSNGTPVKALDNKGTPTSKPVSKPAVKPSGLKGSQGDVKSVSKTISKTKPSSVKRSQGSPTNRQQISHNKTSKSINKRI